MIKERVNTLIKQNLTALTWRRRPWQNHTLLSAISRIIRFPPQKKHQSWQRGSQHILTCLIFLCMGYDTKYISYCDLFLKKFENYSSRENTEDWTRRRPCTIQHLVGEADTGYCHTSGNCRKEENDKQGIVYWVAATCRPCAQPITLGRIRITWAGAVINSSFQIRKLRPSEVKCLGWCQLGFEPALTPTKWP